MCKTPSVFAHFHIKTLKTHGRGENSTLKRPWGGLGAALGPTWAHLGPLSGKSCFKNWLWNLDLAKSIILPKVLHGYFLAAEADMSRHAEIGRRYHRKWGSPCRNPQFL